MRNNGGIENYYFEINETFEGNLDESRNQEGHIIREFIIREKIHLRKNPEMYVLNHYIASQIRNEKWVNDDIFRKKNYNIKRKNKKLMKYIEIK